MHLSLNEIETMSKRAARGAGLSWGIAEEAGKSARWLATRGLFGPERLADLLVHHDQHPYADLAPSDTDDIWKAPAGVLSPLIAGATLSDKALDIAKGRVIELAETREPLWLVPYAAGAVSLTGAAISIAWDDVVMVLSEKGEWIEGHQNALTVSRTAGVHCQKGGQFHAPTVMTRAPDNVSPAAWSRLAAFAERTYAPATDASRLSGAGAGLTDNN